MANANRFCLALLLMTLLCMIIGMFLVAFSMRYTDPDNQEMDGLIRRSTETEERTHKEPYPVFPEDYHASGLLILPHSSIAEPFEIWYSNTLGTSRIDYYYGTDKTFQRGDEPPNGKYYKIVPMYNDKQGNFEGCWTVTGRERWPIMAQTIIPNITWFKYVKTEVYTGVLATKWHYEYWAYGMLNSQNVWVTKSKPHRPIRYEMKGYDSMLGSYYDHYVLEYVSFEQWRPQMKRFELPRDIPCFNWSLTLEASLIANPMQEFTKFATEPSLDTSEMFNEFKNSHGKNYDDENEHKKRKNIFKHNMRFIQSMNRKNSHFKMKSNHFTDMSDEEFETHVGSMTKFDSRNHTGMKALHKHDPVYLGSAPKPVDVPDELDWRDYGAVSSVKGQGICGSCYTFSAAGAAEGAHFLKTGKLVEISSQQILDCSWGSGNHGCKGGHYAAALSFLYLHGAATLESYGKYLAQEGVCHFNDTLLAAKIDAFAYVPSYNNTALKHAIAKFGPAAVSINVSPLSFKFYSNGVYHDKDCWPNRTRHSALVVGYGKIKNGKEYWLVKNSWSDSWGERGYIRVAMDNNMCGITESPVVALVNHITFQFPVKEKILSVDSEDEASLGHKVRAVKRKGKDGGADRRGSGNEKILDSINKELDKELRNGLMKDLVKSNKSKKKKQKKSKKVFEISNSGLKNEKKMAVKEEMPNTPETVKTDEKKQSETMDDKETPKIEKNDVRNDIGALGEMVVNASVNGNREGLNFDAMKDGGGMKEGVKNEGVKNEGVKSENVKNEKVKSPEMIPLKDTSHVTMDDFKLPSFTGNVDQSKLPNTLSENSNVVKSGGGKTLINDEKPVESEKNKENGLKNDIGGVSLELNGERKKGKKNEKLYHASENGVDVTVQDTSGLNDIQVSVSKVIEKQEKAKKGKKNKKKKKKKVEKDKLKAKERQSENNGKNKIGALPVSKTKLRRVLKDTLKSLYKKIDKAMLKQVKLKT